MPARSEVAGQVSRFAAAGLINTAIDYLVFVILSWALALPLHASWIAKTCSGTLAMANSFALNQRWVFRARDHGGWRRAARFLAVTLFGTFVIQLGGMHLLTAIAPAPGKIAYTIVTTLGADPWLPRPFVIRTTAFALATAASMTWNFLAYRRWVFPTASPAPHRPSKRPPNALTPNPNPGT